MTTFFYQSYPVMEYSIIDYKIEKHVKKANSDFLALLKNRDEMIDGKSNILRGHDMANFTEEDYMDMI